MEISLENMSKAELINFIDEQNSRLKQQNQEILRQESENRKQELEIQAKELEIQAKEQKIQQYEYMVAQLKRMLFGSKRERFAKHHPAQGVIPFEEYATEEQKLDQTSIKEIITYERDKPSNHKGRNKLPENLPVVEHVIEPQEDTSEMIKIGEERTEILEYTPEKFFKLVIVRPKYALKQENQSFDPDSATKNFATSIRSS